MCGLVGWISDEKGSDSFDRRKFIDLALILDTIRGGDSTGVFVVDNNWNNAPTSAVNWRKQLSGGHEFVISSEYKELWSNGKAMDYKYCVGHNRSATVGGVVLEAAHPFVEGPITLVHNGTVKKEYTSEKELANDSHGICWRLSKEEPEKVIKELDGAFALIWHDSRDDSLNFVRNSQRPLHMAKAAGNDTIYFASEAEMLFWLDRKLTLKLQDICSMKSAHWVKFTPGKLMVPAVKEVELYVPKVHQSQIGAYTAAQWSGTGKSANGWTKKNQTNTGRTTKSHKPKSPYDTHPESLQEALLEYGLYIDQEEEFIPMAHQEWNWKGKGNEDCSVIGWLMPLDKTFPPIPAVVHGLIPETWNNSNTRMWSVAPIGVHLLAWDLPIVTCRLRATTDLSNSYKTIPPEAKPPTIGLHTKYIKTMVFTEPPKPAPLQQDIDDVSYPGPSGRMLTASEWLLKTKAGCMSCEGDLTLEIDAWSVEWINTDTGIRPMCCQCVDSRSKEGDKELEEIELDESPNNKWSTDAEQMVADLQEHMKGITKEDV